MSLLQSFRKEFSFTEGLTAEILEDFSQFSFDTCFFDQVLIRFKANCGTPSMFAYKASLIMLDLHSKGSVHTHGDLFVSGYFKLFLLGTRRTITPDSVGIIHLPVPMQGHKVIHGITADRLEQDRRNAAELISQRTMLSVQDVFAMDNQKLNARQMIEMGIAHEIIESYGTLISS